MKTLAAGVRPANPAVCALAELRRVRLALIAQFHTAADKAMWSREPESAGMPHRLFAAGCFLAAHGFDDQQCEGERWFNVDFAAYRKFVAFTDMVEEGRRAIYEGRRAFAPLPTMEMAA